VVRSSAVTAAMEDGVEAFYGVTKARLQLHGDRTAPTARLIVDVNDRADLADLRQYLAQEALPTCVMPECDGSAGACPAPIQRQAGTAGAVSHPFGASRVNPSKRSPLAPSPRPARVRRPSQTSDRPSNHRAY
jgi:hypothetical protein